jgi:hypothetical protein
LGKDSFIRNTWGGMGRAIFGSAAIVMFAVMILVMSILAGANPMRVQPHEAGISLLSSELGLEVATSEAKMTKVDYYLPYPGILPDSPLYKLKAARDGVGLFFTFDQAKKAKKELLYADKRINAAMFLVDGGKTALGVSTATKGEKYLQSSMNRIIELQGKGKDEKSMLLTLEKAGLKHAELLESMAEKLTGQEKDVLKQSRMNTEISVQNVQQILREAN